MGTHDGTFCFDPDARRCDSASYDEQTRALEGEKRLMLAVLEDALHCYQRHLASGTVRHKRLFRDVERWFMERPSRGVVSFQYVCDVIGLDADYVRRCLRMWRTRGVTAPSRPRLKSSVTAGLRIRRKYAAARLLKSLGAPVSDPPSLAPATRKKRGARRSSTAKAARRDPAQDGTA